VSEWKFRVVGTLGAALVRTLHATCRVTTEGDEGWRRLSEEGRPWVWCIWHGTMLPPIWRHRDEAVIALVSEHRDGEYITRVLEKLGFGTARGSSTRGGAKGLRGLLRAARSGRTLAVTPDGPQGPRERMKPGALMAAQRGGLPIVPIGVGLSRAWRFSSWDRFSIPKPFARVHLVYGVPIEVPAGLDAEGLAAVSERVQTALDEVTRTARAVAGDPGPAAPGSEDAGRERDR